MRTVDALSSFMSYSTSLPFLLDLRRFDFNSLPLVTRQGAALRHMSASTNYQDCR